MHHLPYDNTFKASALNSLHTAGYPSRRGALIAVSRAMGVPTASLRRWATAMSGDVSPLIAPLAGVGTLPRTLTEPRDGALPDAIRAELLATLRSMAAARTEASYKELSAGFAVLAEKLRQLDSVSVPDSPDESGPGEARERLALLVGVGEPLSGS